MYSASQMSTSPLRSAHSDFAQQLERWRADTPGCERRVHLNNAGAALMPRPVRAAIDDHLNLETEIGGYEAAEQRADEIAAVYADVARLLGAQVRNVALMQNSTVGFAQALSTFDFEPGDRIVTTRADYASNQIMYLSLARRRRIEIVRAADLPEGGVDPDSVRDILRQRPAALVSVSWVPTNSGLVQDAESIGTVCAEAGVPYLVDACQAIGQIPIDVGRLRCDYLAAAARKFLRGPRGIGFLYASDKVLAAGAYPLLVDMHGATWTDPDTFMLTPDARRFETWEFSHALVFGLGAAARYALDVGVETAGRRARHLAARARAGLAAVPGVRVLDRGRELCAIVTAELAGRHAKGVKLELRRRGVNASSPERDDAVLDMDAKGAASALRISPHYYNTDAEIDRAISEIRNIMGVP